jgi:HK97 family phage major capsid protein/HK97 family phage prohead protease
MDLEHKSIQPSEVKAVDDGQGIIEAIVSVFSTPDAAGEVVMPGAFKKSLARRKPRMVFAHKWDQPIGATLEARELLPGEKNATGGLYIKGQLNLDTQAGREAYSNIRKNIISEFSIGYRVIKDSYNKTKTLRHLHELDLYEVSAVLVGLHADTALLSVKGETMSALEENFDYKAVEDRLQALEHSATQPVNRPNFGGRPAGHQLHEVKSLGQQFVESREYQNWLGSKSMESSQFLSDVRLKAVLTTTTGWPVENVRSPVMVPFATRQPMVADIIPHIETTQNAYVYMEETTYTNAAVEVLEGGLKPEAALALTQRTSPVRKIAAWLAATDEQLDDVIGMQAYIEQRLSFMVAQRLDQQIISGNGTAPNLLGILNVVGIQTQAKATDPTPDAFAKAINKVRAVGQAEPNAIIIHPNDWVEVQTLRTTDGIYIAGSPWDMGPGTLWGKPVIVTTAITEGTGLVGAFDQFSQIAERQRISVKVGYNADDFLKNQKSIVGETRVAVVWYRPSAFCTVSGI